jgi:DNA-binding NarL/FixJ family response regulator
MTKLLLVDDQVLFREGLAFLLSKQPDIEIVGEANDGFEAIELAAQLQPDVILMDIRMPTLNGIEATKAIHQKFPWIKILVLTTFDQDDYIWQALQAGALGFLLKNTPVEKMVDSIRAVDHGYGQLDPMIAARVFSKIIQFEQKITIDDHWQELFNDRECEVLLKLTQGKNNKEIAQEMDLSEGTIKNHITRILWQLGLRDRTQAALWAQRYLDKADSTSEI